MEPPGVPLTEDFDTLASTGTSSTTPAGWTFAEAGTNAEGTYAAGTGSSNTGNTYSFGAAGSTERAFGGLLSSSLIPTIGASFQNNTSTTLTTLTISYTGELWRLGAVGRPDRLDFQFSTDATSLTTGTWIDVDVLDFIAPVTTGTAGALDGNAAANRTSLTNSIGGLTIPVGAVVWIRWSDFNASSSDDGLGVDDFSLSAEEVFLSKDKQFDAGMYRSGKVRAEITKPYGVNEYMHFHEGGVTLTSSDGTMTEIRAGDSVVIPADWTGVWDTEGYTKIYVIYSPGGPITE